MEPRALSLTMGSILIGRKDRDRWTPRGSFWAWGRMMTPAHNPPAARMGNRRVFQSPSSQKTNPKVSANKMRADLNPETKHAATARRRKSNRHGLVKSNKPLM